MTVWTDVMAPGSPEIVSLTCQSGNTMFLRWVRPEMFFRTVDVYTVHYRPRPSLGSASAEWEQQLVETVNNTINHMMYINNLTTNTAYEVRVRAATYGNLSASAFLALQGEGEGEGEDGDEAEGEGVMVR